MDLTYEEQSELNKIIKNYKIIKPFIKKFKRLSFVEFDYLIVHELTLFTVEPDFSFETLEERINVILNALPSIKRIFAQPCIHLKEQAVILPTESVRIINNKTIQHIASHSELWTDVNVNEVKPSRLLTRIYEDNYGIYENKVFCKTVDDILAFSKKNLRILKEMIYTSQTIELNLLERVNHLNYYLALGKLHTGYSRNFDSYYDVSMRCLNKLQYITSNLIPRLKRPVYKNNKTHSVNIKLHKTNILAMHREYHQIYKLANYFALHHLNDVKEITSKDMSALANNYFYFCEFLTIFSVSHFNFTNYDDGPLNFARLNANFIFKGWKLNLKKCKCGDFYVLSISVEKDRKFKIILIPSVLKDNVDIFEMVQHTFKADEYTVCTPFEEYDENSTPISMTEADSFRRIQQIILRAMIYADEKRKECPFCNNKLVPDEETISSNMPVYKCSICRTAIHTGYCPETKKTFQYTKIANLTHTPNIGNDWLIKRKRQVQMYFRNITKLNEYSEIICPHCNKVHYNN